MNSTSAKQHQLFSAARALSFQSKNESKVLDMADKAEFEEKTYEKLFGHELAKKCSVPPFSPGQHAEYHLGFDEAFMVPWVSYISLFRHVSGSIWRKPQGISFSELDDSITEDVKHLPEYKFNFFVQFKRPEYVSGNRGAERNVWNTPYFRYEITPHQQEALEAIALSAGKRAAVIYSAPAFWESKVLFAHAEKKRIIENSNIALAEKMCGHKKYTYKLAGGQGVAHSDPEFVSSPTFEQILQTGLEQRPLPFERHVRETAKLILSSVENDPVRYEKINAARRAIVSMAEIEDDPNEPERLLSALITMESFSDAFGVKIYSVG